ncbi:hypothetical protein [Cellulosilyticum ruminicola]|uniref:hypothetical protein n=1 Tax=Cellulosilyticum ruminicola TaxID=425254 RepID=UPI0006D03C2A|nr:hypothetical protein [Cellulosilyticum ruminicola]
MKGVEKWSQQIKSFLIDLLKHMKKLIIINICLAVVLSIIWAFAEVYIDTPSFENRVECLSSTPEDICMTLNSGSREYIIKLNQNLDVNYLYSENKIKQNELLQIEDIASDMAHNIYLLTTITNVKNHEVKQQIIKLSTGFLKSSHKKILVECLEPSIVFSKLNVSEDEGQLQFNILGIKKENNNLCRQKWVQQTRANTLIKTIDKSYKMPTHEKLHSLFSVYKEVGGITDQGELYISKSDRLSKVPIDGKETVDYHILSAQVDWDNNLYVAVEETGDIRRINVVTNKSQLMFWGREIFKGSTTNYSSCYKMAYQMKKSLVAVTSEEEAKHVQIFVTNNGGKDAISAVTLRLSPVTVLRLIAYTILPLFLSLLVMVAIIIVLMYFIQNSPYVFIRLTCYIVPIVVVSIIVFSVGVIHLYTLQVENDNRKDIKSTSELLLSGINTEKVEDLWYKKGRVEENELSKILLNDAVSTRLILVKDETLLITMDDEIPNYYALKHYTSPSEYAQYKAVINSGMPLEKGNVIYKEGRHLVRLLPIKNSNQEVEAILEVGENFLYGKTQIQAFIKRIIRLIIYIALIIIVVVSLVIKQTLVPLKKIEGCLKSWKEQEKAEHLQSYGYDEFANISKILNTLIAEKVSNQYDLNEITKHYYSFVPKKFFGLLEKNSIQEMTVGTYKQMNKPIAITSYRYLNILEQTVSGVAQIMNDNFRIINKTVGKYDGVLNIEHRYFFDVTALYDEPHKALEASFIIHEKLNKNNKVAGILRENMQQVTLLDQLDIRLELAGEMDRVKPVFLAYRLEWLYGFLPLFRKMACNIIATKEYIEQIQESYKCRYIGYVLGPSNEKVDLYDYYEGDIKEVRQAKESTQDQFEMALDYFYKADFPNARNWFLQVIKENKLDEIAKWYLTKCNSFVSKETKVQDMALLIYDESLNRA